MFQRRATLSYGSCRSSNKVSIEKFGKTSAVKKRERNSSSLFIVYRELEIYCYVGWNFKENPIYRVILVLLPELNFSDNFPYPQRCHKCHRCQRCVFDKLWASRYHTMCIIPYLRYEHNFLRNRSIISIYTIFFVE